MIVSQYLSFRNDSFLPRISTCIFIGDDLIKKIVSINRDVNELLHAKTKTTSRLLYHKTETF